MFPSKGARTLHPTERQATFVGRGTNRAVTVHDAPGGWTLARAGLLERALHGESENFSTRDTNSTNITVYRKPAPAAIHSPQPHAA